jgi:hypothetical protein
LGSVALTTKTHISGEQECQSFKLDGFILPAHKIALQKTSDFLLPFDLCESCASVRYRPTHFGPRAKGFKIEHWFGHALDGTMILLDNIVEILDLTNFDRQFSVMIDPIDGGFIGGPVEEPPKVFVLS